MPLRLVLIVCCGFLSLGTALAEDWPNWRGPRGDGTSLETSVPTQWNGATGENIAWKVELPGEGHGSPIVCGDNVFIVTCNKTSLERSLLCLSRTTGETRWSRVVVKSPLETKHQLNSFASCTPACDGETVYVAFLESKGDLVPATNVGTPRPVTAGSVVVAAYTLAGEQKWLVRPGSFISVHGFCSNPVVYQDRVILNGDHDGESYVVALDKRTGETIWKQPREHKTRSYCTPIIRDVAGKTQMVFSGSKSIVSLDPQSGKTHWTIDGPTEQFVASMVFDGAQFYMAAGFPTYHVLAIRPDGSGNVTDSHVTWHAKNVNCYVPSPVLSGQYLLVADDRGTANCFDTATGERLWLERLGSHYSASLLAADGKVYFTADDGETKIIEPGPTLKIVAKNGLGEGSYASAAISDGQIFVRGDKHLFCIGKR